ncbi:MAG: TRAP transporter TatT component family protein [Terriglobales bacterium]
MKNQAMSRLTAACLAIMVLLTNGCSVKQYAINKLGDSLAKSGTNYASDNDPELVGAALPFSLKLIEGLLEESPKHQGLLFAASSGFTQYSYVYVQEQADELEATDIARATELRDRARRLYVRGRDYGLRALEAQHPGFGDKLRQDPRAAAAVLHKNEVPAAYWTAVSWAAVIGVSKEKPATIAEQPQVEALIDRAAALDPDYGAGAIDGFLISYEPARPDSRADFAKRCRSHFERAVELSHGQMASHYVALAEAVTVQKQDRSQFDSLLKQALAIDADQRPEWRLANLIYQRRARWLLSREDELFVGSLDPGDQSATNSSAAQKESR